jgi:chemotaxis protein histidine kinase CheA
MSSEDDRERARATLTAKFRASARERVRRLNLAIVALERDPSAGEVQQEALREIHTLKGEARLVGLADVADAADKTEEVLFHARKSGFQVGPDVHDLMLAGLDLLSALLTGAATNATLGGYAARVDALVARPDAAPEPPLARAPEALPSPALPASAEASFHALANAGHEGWISVDLGKVDHLTNVIGDLAQDQARRERALAALADLSHSLRDDIHLAHSLLQRIFEDIFDDEGTEISALRQVMHRQMALERELRGLLSRTKEDVFEERLRVDEAEGRLREMRMTPTSELFSRYVRGARDLARELGKRVRVDVQGEDVAADKRVLDQVADPLLHLVRNAVDHGIEDAERRGAAGKPEEGRVLLAAAHAGGRLRFTVSDDDAAAVGSAAVTRGLITEEERAAATREQILDLIFREGFSTRNAVSSVSGRGVGMDVVRRRIEALGGSITTKSEAGRGTAFVLDVPLSLALVEVLLFREAGVAYALPTSCLDRVLTPEAIQPLSAAGGTVFHVDSEIVPLGEFAGVVGAPPLSAADAGAARVVVLAQRGRKLGLRVSQVVGYRALVQRELDPFLSGVSLIAGTAMLGENEMALVLDPAELIGGGAVRAVARALSAPKSPRSILLVDDSEITRLLLAEIFKRLGYEVREASDGRRALDAVATRLPDLILLDLDMPVMSGFGFLEAFRAGAGAQGHVPIVVFSSRGSDEDKRRSVGLGADAYLVKSRFQESDLVETVQRFLPADPP